MAPVTTYPLEVIQPVRDRASGMAGGRGVGVTGSTRLRLTGRPFGNACPFRLSRHYRN